ncbi:Myb-like dna-binding protein, partial [Globisporangium splendens]
MSSNNNTTERGVWSEHEHDKFLEGLKMYPQGPWKAIAAHIGTRSSRQVQTHAQKYYEKVARRMRGLRKDRKKVVRSEHRLGDDMTSLCARNELKETGIRIGQIRRGLNVVADISGNSSSSPARGQTSDEQSWGLATNASPSLNAGASPLLDWVDALIEEDEDMTTMWTARDRELPAAPAAESLIDVDDCYLNYLIEILESSELTISDNN